MHKGVSEFVSAVFFIAIVVVAVGIVLNTALPQLTTMEETSSLQNNIDFLADLDSAIQSVASEGRYSQRQVNLHFQHGEYGFDDENGELYYEIETDSPIISTHSSRFIGPARVSANADVSVTNATVNGIDCYMMENRYLKACIKNLENTTVKTNETLVQLYNKQQNTELNGTLTTLINGENDTITGQGYTTANDNGTSLSRGQITAHLSTSNRTYNITYSLLSGADFLTVETSGDNISTSTTSLSFVVDDEGSDIAYIDGQQRSSGVYTSNDIDFGYGIGQGVSLFAGVVAGNGFTQVGYDNSVGSGRYGINVTSTGESIFLIPFTEGGVNDVEDRQNLIKNGVIGNFFNYPAPNFGYSLSNEKTIRATLHYDRFTLSGMDRTIGPGTYQLLIENNGVSNGKTNVSVTVK